ncbi:uncharacterized protein METZ01_LOCUS234186, partial [marine metagenome]
VSAQPSARAGNRHRLARGDLGYLAD